MSAVAMARHWVKTGDGPIATRARRAVLAIRGVQLPVVPGLHRGLYALHRTVAGGLGNLLRVLWHTPLFRSRLETPAHGLFLYGGMPLVTGPLRLRVGRGCRISAATTFSGRWGGGGAPTLQIGDNVDVGWQTTIAVGRRVVLGDNVRIAGRAFLAGYPGHPEDPDRRARGEPDSPLQVGDIVLEDDVWLATGVTVLGGVTIGRGTIVAAGSIVTRDLPPMVLAAGSPARPIRPVRNRDDRP